MPRHENRRKSHNNLKELKNLGMPRPRNVNMSDYEYVVSDNESESEVENDCVLTLENFSYDLVVSTTKTFGIITKIKQRIIEAAMQGQSSVTIEYDYSNSLRVLDSLPNEFYREFSTTTQQLTISWNEMGE